MPEFCSFVRGIVIDATTHLAIAGATVRYGTVVDGRFILLQEGVTQSDGRFSLDANSPALLHEDPGGGHYELHVHQLGRRVEIDEGSDWRWYKTELEIDVVLCVHQHVPCSYSVTPPDVTVNGTGPNLVKGRVRHKDGTPLQGVQVKAYLAHIGPPSPQSHPTTYTSSDATIVANRGYYALRFTPTVSAPHNVFIRVYDATGATLLGTSRVLYKAGTSVTLNLEICHDSYRSDSEYARINAAVGPLVGATAWDALRPADIAYLAGVSSWRVQKVIDYVAAKRLNVDLGSPTPSLTERLYGLMWSGWPRTLSRLLMQRRSDIELTLSHAADANIISRSAANGHADLADALKNELVARSINVATAGSLGALLDAAGFGTTEVGQIVGAYVDAGGSTATFYNDLADTYSYTSAQLERIRDAIRLGVITCNHAPLVELLFAHADWDGDPKMTAGLTQTDWEYLVSTSSHPDGVASDTAYVQILLQNSAAAYPSRRVLADLSGSTAFDLLGTWFTDNADAFDIATDGITEALFPSDPQATEKTRQLQAAQRLYRISPSSRRAAVMETLYSTLEVTSAHEIVRLGRARFKAAATTALLTDAEAREIFSKARSLEAMALAVYTANHPNLIGPEVSFLGGTVDASTYTSPTNYASLFGGVSFCSCEHCRSVLSPAAYLVDLLQWVEARGGRTELESRRADLFALELTCQNTNRALPYVDLVNEVLENAVSPTSAVSTTSTDVLTPDLLAVPQYINAGAYDTLRAAVYPQRAPFDLWAEMSRRYLRHLGVERADLMRAFWRDDNEEPSTLALYATAAQIDMEDLGVTQTQAGILTATTGAYLYWNYANDGAMCSGLAADIRGLLLKAELTYDQLLDLLHSEFVNPSALFTLEIPEGSECDLTEFTITYDSASTPTTQAAGWLRATKLLRMARILGLSLLETDRVLRSFGYTDLDSSALTTLASFQRLRRVLDVEPLALASWFGTMNRREDRDGKEDPVDPLYTRVYLNPSVFPKTVLDEQVSGAYTFPFRLDSAGTAIVANGADPATYSSQLKAALGIGDDDLLYAGRWIGTGWTLSLANLELLYSVVTLSQALGLSVRHTRRFKILLGVDPFSSTSACYGFVESVRELTSRFDADQLDYLCAHVHTPPSVDDEDEKARGLVGPTDDWKAATLGELRDTLKKVFVDLPRHDDERADDDGTLVAAALEEVLLDAAGNVDTTAVTAVTTLLGTLPGTSPPDDFYVTYQGTVTSYLVPLYSDSAALVARLAPSSLAAGTHLTTTAERYAFGVWLVRQYQARTGRESDASGTKVKAALEEVLLNDIGMADSAAVEAVMTILALVASTTTPYTTGHRTTLTTYLAPLVRDADAMIDRLAPDETDPDDFPLSYLETAAERYAYVLWAVRYWQARERARAAVVDALAVAVGRERASIEGLRTLTGGFDALAAYAPIGASTVEDFTDLLVDDDFVASSGSTDDPWSDLDEDTHAGPWATVEVVFKAAMLLNGVDVSVDEQTWWQDNGPTFSLFDLSTLPLTKADSTATTSLAGIHRAVDLFRQRDRLPGTRPSFDELLTSLSTWDAAMAAGATPTSDFPADLASRAGWTESDIDALMTALRVSEATTASTTDGDRTSLRDVANFERFLDALLITRRIGVDATTIEATKWWALGTIGTDTTVWPTEDTAKAIEAAVRARYATPSGWSTVARPLRDGLREEQRAALVGYLLARITDTTVRDASVLYGEYLIDVDMSPCMLTSRIKQAACSVQLFVQRSLMGLESTLTLNDDDREEWEWMKNYRVWEAARKVFLYPENWIEPELRDDKTPLFRAFESDISQGELDEERAEEALLGYLDKLHDIARLHVLAYYWQKETDSEGDIDVLHVFARTQGTPANYYYRRWEDRSTWTHWEKVDCGVEGDTLLPVVYNRRLLLFWASFVQMSASTENASPSKWWEVQLSWSEYRNEKWTSKRVGSSMLSLENTDSPDADPNNYSLTSNVTNNVLTIALYSFSDDRLGYFTLNPCTMELSATGGTVEGSRYSFESAGPDGSALRPAVQYTRVAVALGSVGPDYEMSGVPEFIPLLDFAEERGMAFAVTNQFHDFLSQTPFFVAYGDKSWFVVPDLDGEDTDEAEDFRSIGGSDLSRAPSNPETPVDDGVNYTGDSGDFDTAVAAVAEMDTLYGDALINSSNGLYRFHTFHHPYVCTFIKEVRRNGVFSLYLPDPDGEAADLALQQIDDTEYFANDFAPTVYVDSDYPVDDVDFERGSPYGIYNWELFFHVPFLMANRLSQDQQFAEAMDWYHTVFDPRRRDETGAWKSYWKIRPFHKEDPSTPVTDWAAFTGANGDSEAATAFESQVAEWREDPFNPHLIARLRPGTYQKAIAMKYLDNLIAWGDQLFTRDTIESINEATQIYIYAKSVLGDRPEILSPATDPEAKSYTQLSASGGGLDAFSNALVTVENDLFEPSGSGATTDDGTVLPNIGVTAYFCVVPNDRLMKYWDTVDDRLFKIRHCMNIEGVVRQLPLFEPPIDPALLVKAAAAGLSIGAVLADTQSAISNYRFTAVMQKAQAVVGSVKALGQSLLSALEKRDAEALALLRGEHEIALHELVLQTRREQLNEARANLAATRESKTTAQTRKDYYEGLIEVKQIPQEKKQIENLELGQFFTDTAQGFHTLGAFLAIIPDTTSPPVPGVTWGGTNFHNLMAGFGTAASGVAGRFQFMAQMNDIRATRARRMQEWKHQKKLANKELAQIEKQIVAAEIRVAVAELEVKNQERQLTNARSIDEWMRFKFTNAELYTWMVGQVSAMYFAAYQLAYELARKAQASYRYELGLPNATFIQHGHWDNLRKGLLAGERLGHELERMDVAWLDADRREYEITKSISLQLLDPVAVVALQATGECRFELPEALFDLDFPGHYFRRIQSVTVSIPCVVGPNAGVNATLTLTESRTRVSTATSTGGASTYTDRGEDDRFVSDTRSQSIALSGGQDDGGVFQLDLRDARYLPFERRGVISSWTLKLAGSDGNTKRQFDWESLTDVVVKLRYTAREGGSVLAAAVKSSGSIAPTTLLARLNALTGTDGTTGLQRVFSAKRDFPDEWYVTTSATGGTSLSFSASLSSALFPYFAQPCTIKTQRIRCYLLMSSPAAPTDPDTNGTLSLNGVGPLDTNDDGTPDVQPAWSYSTDPTVHLGLPYLEVQLDEEVTISTTDLTFSTSGWTTTLANLRDLVIVVDYDLS
jgi:hypothetical protein